MVELVKGEGLECHGQLGGAELVGSMVAGDHVLDTDFRLGIEGLARAALDVVDLGIDNLQAEQHMAEELPGIGVRETLLAFEFDRFADVVHEHTDEQEIAIHVGVEWSDQVGQPREVHHVVEQASGVGMVMLDACWGASEAIHEGRIAKDLGREGVQRWPQAGQQTVELRQQTIDIRIGEHAELPIIDVARVGPFNRGDDDLHRARIELRVSIYANVIAVFETGEVGVGGVPEPAGDRAALVGEFHLQVELSIPVGPELLVRRQENLVDMGLGRQLRDQASIHRGASVRGGDAIPQTPRRPLQSPTFPRSNRAMPANAISPTRAEDYPEWYQQVVRAADLAEQSPVRGCMVIKPHGYAIWERMQCILDRMFKATGHVNAYFPLFIPLSYLEQEAKHVEGFAKECAVVTHHRLELGPDGKLIPTGKLEEPLVVRPTSETIIGAMYAKWIQSWRDLPLLVNQWANVVRWEMRPRVFLRTAEFLWQEGHTAHATQDEAVEETLRILDIYATFAERDLAMPVIKGPKPAGERFPGAVDTFSIEAMMQDGKALQAGTSHFLGQNFARAQSIKFANTEGVEEFCWTTSWGVSTRLIGAVIMTHSDDDGLVLPPRIAPQHAVLLPIARTDEERGAMLEACHSLEGELAAASFAGEPVRVKTDARDIRGGDKVWQHIKQGVPVRIEIGPRDLAAGTASVTRRDRGPKEREAIPLADLPARLPVILAEIQQWLFDRAVAFRESHSVRLGSAAEVTEYFGRSEAGFAHVHVADDPAVAALLDPLKVSVRCTPMDGPHEPGACVVTGREVPRRSVLARSY